MNTNTRKGFVRYYATLLVPWWPHDDDAAADSTLGTKSAEHYFDPDAFSTLMDQWSDETCENSTAVNRSRYCSFHAMVHGLNAPWKHRVACNKFRSRNRDMWDLMDAKDVPLAPEDANRGKDSDFDIAAVNIARDSIAALQEDANAHAHGFRAKRKKYLEGFHETHAKIYGDTSLDSEKPLAKEGPVSLSDGVQNISTRYSSQACINLMATLNNPRETEMEAPQDDVDLGQDIRARDAHGKESGDLVEDDDGYFTCGPYKLNEGQKKAFDACANVAKKKTSSSSYARRPRNGQNAYLSGNRTLFECPREANACCILYVERGLSNESSMQEVQFAQSTESQRPAIECQANVQ